MTTDTTGRLTADDLDNVRHALGFKDGKPPKLPYRNRYITASDDPSMLRLVDHGFVRLARGPSDLHAGDSVFVATTEGMRAVGCTPTFIKKMQELR